MGPEPKISWTEQNLLCAPKMFRELCMSSAPAKRLRQRPTSRIGLGRESPRKTDPRTFTNGFVALNLCKLRLP